MFLNQINSYMEIFLYVLLGIVAVGVIIFIIFSKSSKKIKVKEEVSTKGHVELDDSSTLIPLDRIVDTENGGIIIKEEDKKFIALLSTVGSEWASASENEKKSRIVSEISRMNTIDRPIQVWQYSRPVKLDEHIERFEKRRKEIVEQALIEKENFDYMKKEAELVPDEEFDIYYDELEKKRKLVHSLDWHRKNVEQQIEYMKRISGGNSEPDICIVYVVEWDYNSNNFTEELTEDDIWTQAKKELLNKSRGLINSLLTSGVYAKRMTRDEIIEAFRVQTNPLTYNMYDIRTILASDAYEPIADSDSEAYFVKRAEEENKNKQDLEDFIYSADPEKFDRYKKMASQNIKFQLKCIKCGNKHTLNLTNGQYNRLVSFLEGNGNVDDMLYDFSNDAVNMIVSGECKKCMFERMDND